MPIQLHLQVLKDPADRLIHELGHLEAPFRSADLPPEACFGTLKSAENSTIQDKRLSDVPAGGPGTDSFPKVMQDPQQIDVSIIAMQEEGGLSQIEDLQRDEHRSTRAPRLAIHPGFQDRNFPQADPPVGRLPSGLAPTEPRVPGDLVVLDALPALDGPQVPDRRASPFPRSEVGRAVAVETPLCRQVVPAFPEHLLELRFPVAKRGDEDRT